MSTVKKQRIAPGVRQRLFTKAEYHRMGEEGFFQGERVELIEGKLMVYSPQLAPHSTSVYLAQLALSQVFTSGHMVRIQLPLDLGQTTEPEPDAAVVAGDPVQSS